MTTQAELFERARALVEEGRVADSEGHIRVVLATADAEGRPSARVVLLKEIDDQGFLFYTNGRSRKGRELAARPQAALVFYKSVLGQQLRVEGATEELEPEKVDAYWATRPRESQLGALASDQSDLLDAVESLEARYDELDAEFEGRDIPRPSHWTGYRIVPDRIEFWRHRDHRLHDRELFTRGGDDWKRELLYP